MQTSHPILLGLCEIGGPEYRVVDHCVGIVSSQVTVERRMGDGDRWVRVHPNDVPLVVAQALRDRSIVLSLDDPHVWDTPVREVFAI